MNHDPDRTETDSAAAAAAPVTASEAQATASKVQAHQVTAHPPGSSGLRPLIWVSAVILLVILLLFLYR